MLRKINPPSFVDHFLFFIFVNIVYILFATFLEYIFDFQLTKAVMNTVGGKGDLTGNYFFGYFFWCFIQSMFGIWVEDTYQQRLKEIDENENNNKKSKKKNTENRKARAATFFYHLKIQIITVFSMPVHYVLIVMAV